MSKIYTNNEVLSKFQVISSRGKHNWAICPCHLDHVPSLQVTVHGDSDIQFTCHVCGSGNKDCLASVGLKYTRKGIVKDTKWNDHKKYNQYVKRVDNYKKKKKKNKDYELLSYPTDRYEYKNVDNSVEFIVQRYEHNSEKTFRQIREYKGKTVWGTTSGWYRPTKYGSYVHGNENDYGAVHLDDVKPILYNLKAIRNSGKVYVLEGEKDTKKAIEVGLTATTQYCGAGQAKNGNTKWRKENLPEFDDKHVILVPDNDVTGISHMTQLAKLLRKRGKCYSIKLMNPVSNKKNGDFYDFWEDEVSKNYNSYIILSHFLDIVDATDYFWENPNMYNIPYNSVSDHAYLSDNQHFQDLDLTQSCNIYSPTGSGKTYALINKAQELMEQGYKVAFSTPTIALAEQLYKNYTNIPMQLVKGGVKVDPNYNFFSTTDASLGKVANNVDMSQTVLIDDEMHEFCIANYRLNSLRALHEYSMQFRSAIHLTGTPVKELENLFDCPTYSYVMDRPRQKYKEIIYDSNLEQVIEGQIVHGCINVIMRNNKKANKESVEYFREKGYVAISLHRDCRNKKDANYDKLSSHEMERLIEKQCFSKDFAGKTVIVFATAVLEAGISILSGEENDQKNRRVKLGSFFFFGHVPSQSIAQSVNRFRDLVPEMVYLCRPKSRKIDYMEFYDMNETMNRRRGDATIISDMLNALCEKEFEGEEDWSVNDSQDVRRYISGNISNLIRVKNDRFEACPIGIASESFTERQRVAAANPIFMRKEMEDMNFEYAGIIEVANEMSKEDVEFKKEIREMCKEEQLERQNEELESYTTLEEVLEDTFLDRFIPNQLYDLIYEYNLTLEQAKSILSSLNFSKQSLNTLKNRMRMLKLMSSKVNEIFKMKMEHLFRIGTKIIPLKYLKKNDYEVDEDRTVDDFNIKEKFMSLYRSDKYLTKILDFCNDRLPFKVKTLLSLFFEVAQDKTYVKELGGGRKRVNCYRIVSSNPLMNYSEQEGFPPIKELMAQIFSTNNMATV